MARKTITGADQFTDFILVSNEEYDVSIYASEGFDGKISVQRQRPTESLTLDPWRDVEVYDLAEFETDIERTGGVVGEFRVRIGCKATDYVAGLVQVEISARG